MASEIAHSSPLLIYSKNKYFYHLSILQLYESFFRIEKVFCQIYLNNISDEERKRYMVMRNIYYPTIIDIYNKEVNKIEFHIMDAHRLHIILLTSVANRV